MSHKCVRCNKLYEDMSSELAKGCDCGSRVFVFVKNDKQQEADYSWLEQELESQGLDKPIAVEATDVENIKVVEKGAYALNLRSLLEGNPLVLKSEHGVYYIRLPKPKKAKKPQ